MIRNAPIRRLGRAAVVGALAVLLGFALRGPGTPLGEARDIAWLFRLRGPVAPPAEGAVVVALQNRAAAELAARCAAKDPPDLCAVEAGRACLALATQGPRPWPRCLYAHLIDRLAAEGVRLIAMDVAFRDGFATVGAADDLRDLPDAVGRAGRVLVAERWQVEQIGANELHRRLPVDPDVAAVALGVAPFPLPKTGAGVHRFWTFKDTLQDMPSLPATAFQAAAVAETVAWLRRLEERAVGPVEVWRTAGQDLLIPGRLVEAMRLLRRTVHADPALAEAALAEIPAAVPEPAAAGRLRALVRLYAGPADALIDFYGPPGTVPLLPAHDVLAAVAGTALHDRVVFVGFADPGNPEQQDAHPTVFTTERGVDLTGVEIAATIYDNFMRGRLREPAPPALVAACLAGFGLVAGLLGATLRGWRGLVGVAAAAGAYLALVGWVFARDGPVLPLAVPLAVQAPFAAVLGLALQYMTQRRQRDALARAVGLFVPGGSGERLAEGGDLLAETELAPGTLLASDAIDFTTLSETLPPGQLRAFMNRYFETLAGAVRRRGGQVTDVKADSMISLWRVGADPAAGRLAACLAALEIRAACPVPVDAASGLALDTRIGLHHDLVAIGAVGGGGRYEFALIGDAANTASRLEGLNKQLGTRVLASAAVVEGLDAILTRPLGRFRVKGRQGVLAVYEPLALRAAASPAQLELAARTTAALALFGERRWAEAEAAFAAILRDWPDDGPARFYLTRCVERAGDPSADDVITLAEK